MPRHERHALGVGRNIAVIPWVVAPIDFFPLLWWRGI